MKRSNPIYDLYISYTEKDEIYGVERTQDSIDAQELYQALTDEGYKVFFRRVSLHAVSPEEEEVYAKRALESARVLLIFGESARSFKKEKMKAEYESFAAKIKNGDRLTSSIIVLYKGMRPDALPEELKGYKSINFSVFGAAPLLFNEIERVLDEEYDAATLEERELEKIKKTFPDFTFDFEFKINTKDKTLTILSYVGEAVSLEKSSNVKTLYADSGFPKLELTIPTKVCGYTVSEIADGCFEVNLDKPSHIISRISQIEAIILPYGLKKIGKNAFRSSSINRIDIPFTATEIGAGAFAGTYLREVNLPLSLRILPDEVFAGCKLLSKISIPQSVTSIGNRAFFGCEKICGLQIPGTVKVGEDAFKGCKWCKVGKYYC